LQVRWKPIKKINTMTEEIKELEEYKEKYEEAMATLDTTFEAIDTIVNYTHLVLNHPNAKEWGIWRRGLLQSLKRVQKNLAESLEIEEG